MSQAGADGVDGDIEGVVAPLTNALSAASFGVGVNNVKHHSLKKKYWSVHVLYMYSPGGEAHFHILAI